MAMSRVRHVCPRTSGTPQLCHSHHPHLAVSLWRARASTDRAGTWPSSHCTGCKGSGKEKANVCRCQVRRGHWAEQLMPGVLRTSLSACGKFACKGEQPERCPVLWAACARGACPARAPAPHQHQASWARQGRGSPPGGWAVGGSAARWEPRYTCPGGRV